MLGGCADPGSGQARSPSRRTSYGVRLAGSRPSTTTIAKWWPYRSQVGVRCPSTSTSQARSVSTQTVAVRLVDVAQDGSDDDLGALGGGLGWGWPGLGSRTLGSHHVCRLRVRKLDRRPAVRPVPGGAAVAGGARRLGPGAAAGRQPEPPRPVEPARRRSARRPAADDPRLRRRRRGRRRQRGRRARGDQLAGLERRRDPRPQAHPAVREAPGHVRRRGRRAAAQPGAQAGRAQLRGGRLPAHRVADGVPDAVHPQRPGARARRCSCRAPAVGWRPRWSRSGPPRATGCG